MSLELIISNSRSNKLWNKLDKGNPKTWPPFKEWVLVIYGEFTESGYDYSLTLGRLYSAQKDRLIFYYKGMQRQQDSVICWAYADRLLELAIDELKLEPRGEFPF